MGRSRRSSAAHSVALASEGWFNDRTGTITNPVPVQSFEEAKAAANSEHELTVGEAIKLYRKAIVFSIIFSTAVVMEGYDLSLMPSFFGLPPFRENYGTEINPAGGKEISAPWQSGILNGTQVCVGLLSLLLLD